MEQAATHATNGSSPVERLSDREEVARLLDELNGDEAQVVRMYHLEGKSYSEISAAVGMPENSIGPTLSAPVKKCAAPAWSDSRSFDRFVISCRLQAISVCALK